MTTTKRDMQSVFWEIASQPKNRREKPTTMKLLQQRPVRVDNSRRGSLFRQYKI